MARKTPPGPMVSPEHMRTPYFSEMTQSMPRYLTVSLAKLSTTKSAPGSASRQSDTASMLQRDVVVLDHHLRQASQLVQPLRHRSPPG